MPKVLRIINRFNLGGISYNVSYLSKYLPEVYETLLIGGPEEVGEKSSLFIPESLGLKPLLINELKRSINPLNDYFAYRRIKKIIRDFRPDIVHTHASKAGAIGRLAASHCRVPVIVHTFHGHVFQGYFSPFISGFFKTIERYLAKRSTAIVAISRIQKEELSITHRICPAEKIKVIPLGFDLHRFTENQAEKRKTFRGTYQLEENEIAIGIVGRLALIKNHFLFVDAIEHLIKSSSIPFKAFIIGDGDTKTQIEDHLKRKNIKYGDTNHAGTQVIFTSWIREIDVALAGLDLVCLTSKNEGTPVSLIEAQAAGKYIISTDVGGIRDILHPACGLLSKEGDHFSYKKNLLHAVQHFGELNAAASKAGTHVIEEFSYSRLCNDMAKLYDDLLNRNHT